jgi:formylglycine-generating enzyme required for sulfatase activity
MRRLLIAIGAALWLGAPASAVTIDWVTVGDPGNACDPQGPGCYGSVDSVYRIGKYEVTNAQYAEFLNAVADTDTYGLYNTSMGDSTFPNLGGITRGGSSGSYTYSTIAGREDMPVNWVSYWDALRFANWLHNGQPTGAQDDGTTEDGAYTLNGYTGDDGSWTTRNPGAVIFLSSDDEWYKAAYYDAVSTSYFDYPAGSDTQTTCAAPGATPNTANCFRDDLTEVGSYTASPSPSGTFDQGGNLWEWNESPSPFEERARRGGSWTDEAIYLHASVWEFIAPYNQMPNTGFRVAMIPEPGTGLLVMTGVVVLAACRRRSA